MLSTETVTYTQVDYSELEQFIFEVYGMHIEIVADQELSNDTKSTYYIRKEVLYEGDAENLESWLSGNYVPYMLNTLLTDMCNRELIEEGEYLVQVSW